MQCKQTVEYGTARSLQSQFSHLHLAGKTGTTNSARDTWFVGVDGENLATVWLGRDDNGETKLTGATGALQVYKDYLQRTTATALYPPPLKASNGWGSLAMVVGIVTVPAKFPCGQIAINPSALNKKHQKNQNNQNAKAYGTYSSRHQIPKPLPWKRQCL